MKRLILHICVFVIFLVSCSMLFAHHIYNVNSSDRSLLEQAQSKGGIRNPLLIDSLVVGLEFVAAEDNMKWYNGDFFYLDLELPSFRRIFFGYEDVDSIVIIPVENRHFVNDPFMSIVQSGLGQTMYQRMIEVVSAERMKINFYQLYQNNKHILHKALSKERYNARFRPIVNILLRAYSDLEQDSTLMPAVERIMKEHENEMLSGNLDQNLGVAYAQIKELLSEETISNYIDPNPITVMWCYPFWLRRMHEGKMEDVWSTLLAIQSDYRE